MIIAAANPTSAWSGLAVSGLFGELCGRAAQAQRYVSFQSNFNSSLGGHS
jgi:hypothetical protein